MDDTIERYKVPWYQEDDSSNYGTSAYVSGQYAEYLKAITLTGDGGAGEVDVYDGSNEQGEHKFNLQVASGDSKVFQFPDHMIFQHGIYVVATGSTTAFTIIHSRVPRSM